MSEDFDPSEVINCNGTEDCSVDGIGRVCYVNVPWSDTKRFCDCSSFNGWKGLNCDEATASVYIERGRL